MRALVWVVGAAAAFAGEAWCDAAPITYVATGNVTAVIVRQSQFAPALAATAVGDQIRFEITFDSAGATDSDALLNQGRYAFAPGSFSATLQIGAAVSSISGSSPMTLSVYNNFLADPSRDNMELILGGTPGPGFFGNSQFSSSPQFDATAWSSDAIPSALGKAPLPLSHTSFNSYFNYSGRSPSLIVGNITDFQVVPAPGAAGAALGAGLLACARRRRR